MTPEQSLKTFKGQITAAGKSLAKLLPAEGIELMLEFYTKTRAVGCDLEGDGDMLLFQWGVYDSDGSETFQLDITRQFMLEDEDEPFQLSLTFHFEPTPALGAIAGSSEWCSTPDDLPAFRKFIEKSAAYKALAQTPPLRTELDFESC